MSSSAISTRVTTPEVSRAAATTCADVTVSSSLRLVPASQAGLASVAMADGSVTVVLPCLNEAASLPGVLSALPSGYRALVVDNNSTDDTAEVARRHGADVVDERRPGYGSAVHAGVEAATTPIVAVVDADGSLDPAELPALVERTRPRRRHGDRSAAPGTRAAVAVARAAGHRGGVLATAQPLRAAGARHRAHACRAPRRRCSPSVSPTAAPGIPLELMVRAAEAGWTVVERDVPYGPRTGGKSKVSGSLRGSIHAGLDFWRAIS